MHVGRLHVRYAARRREAALSRFDADACYAGLRDLARVLDGQRWMVVSGLVEPLVRGRFTRAHSDIDIAVPVDALVPMARVASARGYALTTRALRTHVSTGVDLELHVRIEPWMLAHRRRRLRLWRLDRNGRIDESRFPAYVDVFPYVLEGREMHILDSGQRLPLRESLCQDVALPEGTRVPVELPCYVDALKASRRRARALAGMPDDTPDAAAAEP
ncbi:MAG: hypothetical protein ACHQJ7_03985 [Vicinamibacteria bacterium]|jgi:hypothetical protein